MESATHTTNPPTDETPRDHHLCPWWVGYLIASPLRKLGEHPEKILAPLVQPGMTAVDIGSAMGFFSLPLARMVGNTGRVVCVDVQERMLKSLSRRAQRRGLANIETRLSTQESTGLDDLAGTADLALAIHVVHETAYPRSFLTQCRDVLKPGGKLLLIEPNGHVSESELEETCGLCRDVGFVEIDRTALRRSTALTLERPGSA